jgi:hypothetical protein
VKAVITTPAISRDTRNAVDNQVSQRVFSQVFTFRGEIRDTIYFEVTVPVRLRLKDECPETPDEVLQRWARRN